MTQNHELDIHQHLLKYLLAISTKVSFPIGKVVLSSQSISDAPQYLFRPREPINMGRGTNLRPRRELGRRAGAQRGASDATPIAYEYLILELPNTSFDFLPLVLRVYRLLYIRLGGLSHNDMHQNFSFIAVVFVFKFCPWNLQQFSARTGFEHTTSAS